MKTRFEWNREKNINKHLFRKIHDDDDNNDNNDGDHNVFVHY